MEYRACPRKQCGHKNANAEHVCTMIALGRGGGGGGVTGELGLEYIILFFGWSIYA